MYRAGRIRQIRETAQTMRANYLDLDEEELQLLGLLEEALEEVQRLADQNSSLAEPNAKAA